MSVVIIITLCVLILLAYIFDITSKFTGIPSVILLIALGFVSKLILTSSQIVLPDFNQLLPILGSIGLILIVLEGSLELELNKENNGSILKAFLMALLPMLILAFTIAGIVYYLSGDSFLNALINSVPLAIISSAIAIPSVKHLGKFNHNFVVFESSFSDILGVTIFNFITINSVIDGLAFLNFGWQIVLMLVLSFIATIALGMLLNRINHHVKYVPIIVLVILIYELSKMVHLPALIFVLIFGLVLGNISLLSKYDKTNRLNFDKIIKEVHKLSEILAESAFIIRASFFILFGFLIDVSDITNMEALQLSGMIFSLIILLRIIFLSILKLPILPLLFIAPRGLITILLFLSIPAKNFLPIINNAVIIQVILLTAIWMMLGLMYNKRKA